MVMLDNDLHAYVDGQLDETRRVEVEAWLAGDEESARRVAAYRAQNTALHQMFDSILGEPLPEGVEELRDKVAAQLAGASATATILPWSHRLRRALPQSGTGRPGLRHQPWIRMAAAIALVVTAGSGGWLAGRSPGPAATVAADSPRPTSLQAFAEKATQAHLFYANSRFEVEMGAEDQAALDSWLSERQGRQVAGPDLSAQGYRLLGGRSLPTESGTGTQYMYQSDGRKRLTLFIATPQEGSRAAYSFAQHGDLASFYWVESGLAYALVARLDREQLLTLAQSVHQNLSAPRRAPPASDPTPPAPANDRPKPS